MRKCAFLLLLAVSGLAFAQPKNPFAGSTWQGRVSYRDSYNRPRTDTYELVLAANGTCIITVQSRQDGRELFQEADGLWSYDNSFFRVECDFPTGEIKYLPSLAWASLYQFDAMYNRFTLLVRPWPEADFSVKTAFIRVDD
jgi:hypothetical protein